MNRADDAQLTGVVPENVEDEIEPQQVDEDEIEPTQVDEDEIEPTQVDNDSDEDEQECMTRSNRINRSRDKVQEYSGVYH